MSMRVEISSSSGAMAFLLPCLPETKLLSGLPDIPYFLGYHSSHIFTAADTKALRGTYLFSNSMQLARVKNHPWMIAVLVRSMS